MRHPSFSALFCVLIAGLLLPGCVTSSRQAMPGLVTISGSADIQGDEAVPRRAILQLRLINQSVASDSSAPATFDDTSVSFNSAVVSEAVLYPPPENPIPFSLEVPSALIDPRDQYTLELELYSGSTLLFQGSKTLSLSPNKDASKVSVKISPPPPPPPPPPPAPAAPASSAAPAVPPATVTPPANKQKQASPAQTKETPRAR